MKFGIAAGIIRVVLLTTPIESDAQVWLHADTTYATCAGTYFDGGGNSGKYLNNINSTTTICSDTGNCVVLNFTKFQLDSSDNLILFDGPNATFQLIGTYSGSGLPGIITSSTGCITIWFASDTAGTDSGWSAVVTCQSCGQQGPCLPEMGDCFDTTCTDSFFDSGGSLSGYGNSENLVHTICSDSGNCVKVDFTSFQIEAFFDFMRIYDGPNTGAPMLGQYTGFTGPGTVLSATGCLTFEFLSDNNITTAGWEAIVSCDTCPGGSCLPIMGNCTDYSCTGNFSDPGGPGGNYGNNLNLIQTICSPFGTCSEITFINFDLDTAGDFLTIYAGQDTNSPVYGTFTGSNNPGTITSPTGCLTFHFKTDGSFSNSGWLATLDCANCGSGCLPVINNCTDSTCNSNFYDSGGKAKSYGINEYYSHTICSDSLNCAKVVFTKFDLENGFDFLKVYDGPSTFAPLFGNYTGLGGPDTLTSSYGCLTFEFTSDGSLSEAGWEAVLLCDICPPPCPSPQLGFKPVFSGLNVNFSDTSTFSGNAVFNWDFGDNSSSNVQNPSHTYANDGYYMVCMSLQDSCYLDSICKLIVVGCPDPAINFTWSTNLFQVAFVETGYELAGASFYWDFDDSTNSILQNPVHVFPGSGSYNVCLIVTDSCGTDSFCKQVPVNCPKPTANFSFSVNQLVVSFTDASSSGVSAWIWLFGDGDSSNVQNPVHTYGFGGTYLACLIAIDPCGNDTICKSLTSFCDPPLAGYEVIANSLTAFFTDTSSGNGIFFRSWNFGDGQNSIVQNPIHIFQTKGTYYVCLYVLDSCGQDSACKNVKLTGCANPVTNYNHVLNYMNFSGNDASFPSGPAVYGWDFGDGNTDTAKNVTHTFQAKGTFLVCHSVSDSCGIGKACKTTVVDSTIDTDPYLSTHWAISPNPSTGPITVSIGISTYRSFRWYLSDGLGRMIGSGSGETDFSGKVNLDFAGISGVFTLEFIVGNGKIRERIVILK